MEAVRHQLFERWLNVLAADEELLDIYGEVVALLAALETYGRALEDDLHEESHRVVTSIYDMHALRRTPPSAAAPYAETPPVIRILYVWCRSTTQGTDESPVVLLGGDKTVQGNNWYPPNIAAAERRLEDLTRSQTELEAIKRGRT